MTTGQKIKTTKTTKTGITGNEHIVFFLITVFADLIVMQLLSNSEIISKYSEVQKETIIMCSTGALIIALMLFILWWLRKETWQYLVPFVITAVLTAVGARYFILHLNSKNVVYPIIMFFFSFAYLRHDGSGRWISVNSILEHLLLVAVPLVVLNLAYLSLLEYKEPHLIFMLSAAIIIIVVALANSAAVYGIRHEAKQIFDYFVEFIRGIMLQVLITIAILAVYDYFNITKVDYFISNAISVPIMLITIGEIKSAFNALIKAENIVSKSKYTNKNEKKQKQLNNNLEYKRQYTYIKIILLCCGIALLLLFAPAVFVEIQRSVFYVSIKPSYIIPILVLSSISIVFLLIVVVEYIIKGEDIRKQKKERWGLSIVFALVYLFTGYIMVLLNQPYVINLNPIHFCTVFQIIGCATFVGESFYSNIYRIRSTKHRKDYSVDSYIIIIGSILTMFFTVIPTEGTTFGISKGTLSISSIIISIIGNIFVLVLLPCLFYSAIKPEYKYEEKTVLEGITGEIAKNGFLAVLIAFVAGTIPVMISTVDNGYQNAIIGVLLCIITVYAAVDFCTKNNVQHLSEREREVLEYGQPLTKKESVFHAKRLIGLEEHLRWQNYLALFSLLLYCLFPILMMLCKNTNNFSKVFRKNYYPTLKQDWRKHLIKEDSNRIPQKEMNHNNNRYS